MGKINLRKVITFFSFLFITSATIQAACTYENIINAEEFEVGIMLTWSTANEDGNSMFIIEKSIDGVEFSKIGSLDGAGNSNKSKQYNFLDLMANNKTSFYRLKQIDFDGTSSFSDILATSKENSNQFMVVRLSAAVASDNYEVTFDSSIKGKMNYTLKNWNGTVVSTNQQDIINGLNVITIELEALKPAVYKLELQLNDEIEILTFKKINQESKKKNNFVLNEKDNK